MKNVYLITGNDTSSIGERARILIQELTGGENNAFNLEIYKENDERTFIQVIEEALISLSTPSFLGNKKTIWLENLSFPASNEKSSSTENPLEGRIWTKLVDFITQDFPNDINLVISGPEVSSESQLYASCSKVGRVITCTKPELNSRSWREGIRRAILNKARSLEIKLTNEIIEYLTEVIGVDTDRLTNEIEKIYCYSGKNPTIGQVQELCTGNREAVFYALSSAIGTRDINTALKTVAQLLGHGKEPENLVIGQIRYLGKYINELIQAKLLMSYYKIHSGARLSAIIASMNPADKERFKTNVILSKGSWRIGVLCSHAEKFTGKELITALSLIMNADKLLVSSGLPKQFILETLVLRIITGPQKVLSRN